MKNIKLLIIMFVFAQGMMSVNVQAFSDDLKEEFEKTLNKSMIWLENKVVEGRAKFVDISNLVKEKIENNGQSSLLVEKNAGVNEAPSVQVVDQGPSGKEKEQASSGKEKEQASSGTVVDQASLGAAEEQVQTEPVAKAPAAIMEKDGYIYYCGEKIFNTDSEEGRILQQKNKMISEGTYQALVEECNNDLSKIEKKLLSAWKKANPVILTTTDKIISGTIFTAIIATFVAYHYYSQSDDVENKQ